MNDFWLISSILVKSKYLFFANVYYRLPEDNDYYKFPEITDTLLCSTRMPMVSYEDLLSADVKMISVEPTLVIENFSGNWEKEWMYRTNQGYMSFKLLSPELKVSEHSKLLFKVKNDSQKAGRGHIGIGDYLARFKLEPGDNQVELIPGDFFNNKTKTKPSDWQEAMHQRAKISFKVDGDCRPEEIVFIDL